MASDVHIAEETTVAHIHLARRVRVPVPILLHIPAAGRDFGDRVDAVLQDSPVMVGIFNPHRETAANSNDGDRLIASLLRGFELRAQRADLDQCVFEKFSVLVSGHSLRLPPVLL